MSDRRIRQVTEWADSRCRDDPKCIATHGHKGPHCDMSTRWPRKVDVRIGDTDD